MRPYAALLIPATLAMGCGAGSDSGGACVASADVAALPNVLGNADACGTFALALDAHAYLSLEVAVDAGCDAIVSGGLAMPYAPIYTSMSGDVPKWTFDVLAQELIDGTLEVSCDDGTTWMGFFAIE